MSLTYQIDVAANHVQVVGKGRVTVENCIKMIKRILADPRCNPKQTALLDFRQATFFSRRDGDILDVARQIESVDDMFRGNVAIVARSTTLFVAELLAFHVRVAKHIRIRVFLDLAAAMAFCRTGGKS